MYSKEIDGFQAHLPDNTLSSIEVEEMLKPATTSLIYPKDVWKCLPGLKNAVIGL